MTRADWEITYWGNGFAKFIKSLDSETQAIALAAIEVVLARDGIAICASDWGKSLGGGLYEFRIQKNLRSIQGGRAVNSGPELTKTQKPLLRIFCTFHKNQVIILFHGYDKKRDPSTKRQQREIAAARKLLQEWKYFAR